MTTQLRDVAAFVGIGETPAVRKADKPLKALVLDAITAALDDAGLTPADVDGLVTEGALMPSAMPHDEVAATLGISQYFSGMSSYWGSGIASAHLVGAQAIACGQADVVVSYFGVDWGSTAGAAYTSIGEENSPKVVYEKPFGYFGQPYFFGAIANRYRSTYGVDLERAFGSLAINQRENALRSGTAQMDRSMTYGQYLESPYVAEPLRIPDCCLLTDGAAAAVLVRSDRAKDLPKPPVYLKGASLATMPLSMDNYFTQNPDYLTWPTARPAVEQALAMAGRELDDLDFAELYDCFTMTLLMQIEDIGWCSKGEAAAFVEDGKRVALDGDIPINTHGGLLSHSYLLGATHVTEAIRQLRGDAGDVQVADAELGLVGLLAGPHYGALVLGRDEG
ncbi:MAG: thiolase family protein [Propionibacteriales bacterium]|nr:thiolase family protein [Propionibacteriales bacterium]